MIFMEQESRGRGSKSHRVEGGVVYLRSNRWFFPLARQKLKIFDLNVGGGDCAAIAHRSLTTRMSLYRLRSAMSQSNDWRGCFTDALRLHEKF